MLKNKKFIALCVALCAVGIISAPFFARAMTKEECEDICDNATYDGTDDATALADCKDGCKIYDDDGGAPLGTSGDDGDDEDGGGNIKVDPGVLGSLESNVWGGADSVDVKGLLGDGGVGLGSKDPREMAASIIKVVLGFLGIIAVIIILVGGFKWMTAGGNDDQVGEAKKWIYSGVVGLLIVLASYGLASWVLSQLITKIV